ncbi:MAG TPA: leucyl aminopeptidase family protein [Acidimicrobiales bacterium]|nr:leucyl aminopeptidase family protein [Acidimicrobiales bacterium]
MSRIARISTPVEAAKEPTIVVPVVFDEGAGFIADSVPMTLAGQSIPRSLPKEWCVRQGLKSDAGSCTVLRSVEGSSVVLMSLGSTYNSLENFRLAGAAALRCASEGNVAFLLPTDGIEAPGDAAAALVEGALLASYNFKAMEFDASFDVVPLGSPLPSVPTHDAVANGVARGATVAEAVNWAKRLIDTPPGALPPKELARRVELRLGNDPNVRIESWTESRIKDERLGGLLGVGQGSAQPTRLVYATYDPAPGSELPHVALVGKGVTFDSGGLSLKTGEGMMSMKTDMTGAAVVMSVLSIASRLNLPIRVTAIAPMTENLPGSRAVMPGDVLTFRNGMTAEVLNTDAEGRLILADGLSLAVEANPDAIIDVATLTGAQMVALGDEVGAFYASTDELADYFNAASARSGEPLWRMPLVDAYEAHIESDVADMKNIGKSGKAGSISAALFLRRFTDGRPWVHFDIAGPGRAEANRGYVTKGATAFGARSIVEFLEAVVRDVPKV